MKNLLLSLTFLAIASPSWGLGVANGVVTTSKLGDGSVTTPKLHVDALLPITLDAANSRIGINNNAPGKPLDIKGNSGSTDVIWVKNSSGDSRLAIGHGATTGNTYSTLQAVQASGGSFNDLILQPSGSNVGVGIAAPTAELHISGGTATSAKVTIGEATVAACMMYRDTDLAGWTEVGYLNGAIAYTTVDADGVCDGA